MFGNVFPAGYEYEYDGGDSLSDRASFSYSSDSYCQQNVDRLFYHKKRRFIDVQKETDKSYYILFDRGMPPVWMPKSICKNMRDNSVYIHKATFRKIILSSWNVSENWAETWFPD
jgi:hypothetical protein